MYLDPYPYKDCDPTKGRRGASQPGCVEGYVDPRLGYCRVKAWAIENLRWKSLTHALLKKKTDPTGGGGMSPRSSAPS